MEPMVRSARPGSWNRRSRLMNHQGTVWNRPEPKMFESGSTWNRNRGEPEPDGTGPTRTVAITSCNINA